MSDEKMIEKLIDAAKKEDWDFVDSELPKVGDRKKIIDWSQEQGLKNPDGNIRDLAISVLEITGQKIDPGTEKKLYQLMNGDNNIYVRYRSAFALAAHNSSINRKNISEVLKKALEDEDVSEIARGYLKKFN